MRSYRLREPGEAANIFADFGRGWLDAIDWEKANLVVGLLRGQLRQLPGHHLFGLHPGSARCLAGLIHRPQALSDPLIVAIARFAVKFREGRHARRPGGCGLHESPGIVSAETLDSRSEERRVGKECRSRWSPYH